MNILLMPFAWLLLMLHNIFGSYGLALILFALIVKLILFPFSLKGKKSMIQMNMLSGRMQQIQKKYANDKNKQNEEIQKLYAKEKVNPMGGCLWSFLPLLLLIPLYAVIRQPLTYLMGLDAGQVTTLVGVLNGFAAAPFNQSAAYFQLDAAHVLFENFSAVAANPAVATFKDSLVSINFNFLGVNLAATPIPMFWKLEGGVSWNNIGLFLLPVISAVSSFIFSRVSMKTNVVNEQSAQAANNASMKMMMWMTPLMSLWIGFSMPAGLSIYWIANNLLSMGQEFISGKILKKDYEAAAAAKAEQERLEKEEEKQARREAAERKALAAAEAKKNKGKKPAQEKKPSDASNSEYSKVGIRAYARGRAYDPNRFSPDGPTLYADPAAPIDETAVEKALKKKSDELEHVALEKAADDMIVNEILEEQGSGDVETETAPEIDSAPEELSVENPWGALEKEIHEIQDGNDQEETKE
ncbi:MAG: YidC/Oxa1 family membrane protein insertase [Clostridia bacterium]|nr:YidC/Oxa1 family membrane protein insertase [Clostridia bacterium]